VLRDEPAMLVIENRDRALARRPVRQGLQTQSVYVILRSQ
jgi:hypothetical protein